MAESWVMNCWCFARKAAGDETFMPPTVHYNDAPEDGSVEFPADSHGELGPGWDQATKLHLWWCQQLVPMSPAVSPAEIGSTVGKLCRL